ncbi:MAG TPA: FGGY family carbohydrate kinase [Rectinemataceae bacterium]|nr:FGGY family carbohydrate kinase [Rectinemataceae bacterium]
MEIFLGFDVGTTSIKASAIDKAGVILATAQVPCVMETPKPGYFEIDAPAQWAGGFLRALADLGPEIVSRARALCVSSVCASFVPVDDEGRALRNAIMYGIDTRATTQFERLNRDFPNARLASVAGNGFTSHSVLPKILWLKENEPEIYAKTARFVESSNFITSRLTDRYAWDRPSAAGAHMIDVERGAYPSEFLRDIGVDEGKLPALRYPLDILGSVTRKASLATRLPEGIPVLVGACDVNAEAFACGAFDPGSLLLVYGSTLSTLYTIDSFKTLPGFLIGPSVLEGTYRLGGATSSGGRYLDWIRKLLDMGLPSDLDGGGAPGAILMLPFLDGARIPFQNPDYGVLWYGMSSATTPKDLWKAAMESMGCELSLLLDLFASVGQLPGYAHVTGGLASNRQFLRIVANVSGMPLRHFKNVNAAFGDALMALSIESGLDEVRAVLGARARYPDNVEEIVADRTSFAAYAGKRSAYRKAVAFLRELQS